MQNSPRPTMILSPLLPNSQRPMKFSPLRWTLVINSSYSLSTTSSSSTLIPIVNNLHGRFGPIPGSFLYGCRGVSAHQDTVDVPDRSKYAQEGTIHYMPSGYHNTHWCGREMYKNKTVLRQLVHSANPSWRNHTSAGTSTGKTIHPSPT